MASGRGRSASRRRSSGSTAGWTSSSRSRCAAAGPSRCRRRLHGPSGPTGLGSSMSGSPLVRVERAGPRRRQNLGRAARCPQRHALLPPGARPRQSPAPQVPRSPPHLRVPAARARRVGEGGDGDFGSLSDQPDAKQLQPRHPLASERCRRPDGGAPLRELAACGVTAVQRCPSSWWSAWWSTTMKPPTSGSRGGGFTFRSLEPTLGFEPRTCCLRSRTATVQGRPLRPMASVKRHPRARNRPPRRGASTGLATFVATTFASLRQGGGLARLLAKEHRPHEGPRSARAWGQHPPSSPSASWTRSTRPPRSTPPTTGMAGTSRSSNTTSTTTRAEARSTRWRRSEWLRGITG